MSMSQEIKNHLEQFIYQEQTLLDQLNQLKRQRADVGAEIRKSLISEGARLIAKDIFESSLAGRLGKKLTKSALDQQQKEQYLIQERVIDGRHKFFVQSDRAFLSTISMKRKTSGSRTVIILLLDWTGRKST